MRIPILICLLGLVVSTAHARTHRDLLHLSPASEAGHATSACCKELEAIGFSSNLPVVVMDTGGKAIDEKYVDVPGTLCTCNSGHDFKDFNGSVVASVHGSSSAKFDKKSFTVRLQHANGTSESSKFLGMPKGSEWVLYGGDQVDLTDGMRDYVTYNLGRAMGDYATRTVWIEVFLVTDGKPLALSDYHGIYIGEEHVDRGKDRVDIAKWTMENPSGGYIFEFAHSDYNASTNLVTPGNMPGDDYPLVITYPGSKNKTEADYAAQWLLDYMTEFYKAITADDYLTASPGYMQYVNMSSFVDFFLVTELTKNPDGYRDSIWMHKDRDAPFSMGPIWDFNEAYGECCGFPINGYNQSGQSGPGVAGGSAISPNGWRFLICEDPTRCSAEPDDGVSLWFRRMWNDTRFSTAAAARWEELRAGPWADDAIQNLITTTEAYIHPAVTRDYKVYSSVLWKPWYANTDVQFITEVHNFAAWLAERTAWLDQEFALVKAGNYVYPISNMEPVPEKVGPVGGAPVPAAVAAASAP